MADQFFQKKLSHRLNFTFKDDELLYEAEDSSQRHSFSLKYTDIPFESTTYTQKLEALRGIAILFVILSPFTFLGAFGSAGAYFTAALQLSLAAAALYGYMKVRPTFTFIETERGRLTILHDNQHEAILGQIEGRRRDRLRTLLADVNLENDPEHEARKFSWLKQHGVISEDEYKARMAELKNGDDGGGSSAPRTVH